MQYDAHMTEFVDEMIRKTEKERFVMGMGKLQFSKHLGMHYHTYQSFLKKNRMAHPKTLMIIANFLHDRKSDIDELSRRLEKIVREEMAKLKE